MSIKEVLMDRDEMSAQEAVALKCYKVFDESWKCQNQQYEVGQTYEMEESDISMCNNGYHACERVADCFNYKSFDPKNKVAEVILSGRIIKGENKCCASRITIVKEISWQEMLVLANTGNANTGINNTGHWNTGDLNTGDRNTGHRNAGHRNAGHWNTGHLNTGDLNTGHWNKTNYSTGFFNTKEGTVRIFNKNSGLTHNEFFAKYSIPSCLYFDITKWIDFSDMTEEEKSSHPKAETCGGYLKALGYKEAAIASISKASEADKDLIRALPNYDPNIFEEIFGIRI